MKRRRSWAYMSRLYMRWAYDREARRMRKVWGLVALTEELSREMPLIP